MHINHFLLRKLNFFQTCINILKLWCSFAVVPTSTCRLLCSSCVSGSWATWTGTELSPSPSSARPSIWSWRARTATHCRRASPPRCGQSSCCREATQQTHRRWEEARNNQLPFTLHLILICFFMYLRPECRASDRVRESWSDACSEGRPNSLMTWKWRLLFLCLQGAPVSCWWRQLQLVPREFFFFFLKSSQQQLSSTFAWQRYHINLTLHNGLFIYNFFSVCAHIHLFLYTSLFNLKEHVSVLERLQPSLATISQDLKEETSNKGKQRFIIMIIISRC